MESSDDALLERHRLDASRAIKRHVLLAVGAGLVPSPVVDIIGITAIEVRLIGVLARIYDYPVPRKLVTAKVLVSLAGGVGSVYVGAKLLPTVKLVPGFGHVAFVGAMAVSSGASVYAVGRLFQTHFESGGTFLSSGSPILRERFRTHYEEGRRVVPGYFGPETAPGFA